MGTEQMRDHCTAPGNPSNGQRRVAFSVSEAAAEAGVGRDMIYAAIRDGHLEARKWGRRTIITSEAFERFLHRLPQVRLPPSG
jgi:excisionase family DNA binding protein